MQTLEDLPDTPEGIALYLLCLALRFGQRPRGAEEVLRLYTKFLFAVRCDRDDSPFLLQ